MAQKKLEIMKNPFAEIKTEEEKEKVWEFLKKNAHPLSMEEKKIFMQKAFIHNAVQKYHWVDNRVDALKSEGIEVGIFPMGSGGLLQEKKMKDGSVRIQISYGWGKHNYAYVAVLKQEP